jgi:hypothetical protein
MRVVHVRDRDAVAVYIGATSTAANTTCQSRRGTTRIRCRRKPLEERRPSLKSTAPTSSHSLP